MRDELSDLDLGQRPGFFQTADLEAMGDFLGRDAGVEALRGQRADLTGRAEEAMWHAEELVVENNLRGLPQMIVQGDCASWALHFASRAASRE